MVATWMGEEIDSSLQPANSVTIRAKPGPILMKHAFRYIRSSDNMALMLPILDKQLGRNIHTHLHRTYTLFVIKITAREQHGQSSFAGSHGIGIRLEFRSLPSRSRLHSPGQAPR